MQSGPMVLLVEDSPRTARATAILLSDGAVTAKVTIAPTVDAALAQLRAQQVDLVVLDLALPGGHGLELLAAIRANGGWPGLPVVVLSGLSDPEVVQHSYDLGANCFVRKPRRIAELVPATRAIEQFWQRRVAVESHRGNNTLFQLPLAATADAVREARFVVRRLLDGWGLAMLEDTAELCASELTTNAVLHAQSPVLLGVELTPEAVRFEVEDEAPGELEAGSLVHDEETGRGLALVDELSESWGVEQHDGGKTVWFVLRRPDAPTDHRPGPPADHRPGPPADHRADPPADHRADPPADHRADPPTDHRADPPTDHRPDAPADRRRDTRPRPRDTPSDGAKRRPRAGSDRRAARRADAETDASSGAATNGPNEPPGGDAPDVT